MTPNRIDGVLVEWGDRLFYAPNRVVHSRTPIVGGAALHARPNAVRQRIHAGLVQHAPRVIVKVTGGGRGMGAIAAHLRYVSKSGRLPLEDYRGVVRDGPEALRDLVHLAVRAEGRDGRRLNPRKQDLRRWREVFAEKLRGWGIEAEASSRVKRGSRHHNERLWQRKAREQGRATESGSTETKLTPARRHAAQACAKSPRRSRRRTNGLTASWVGRSSTTPAGCRACATSRPRSSHSGNCRGWSTPCRRRRGPSRVGSDER
jgi:hypothetical protein